MCVCVSCVFDDECCQWKLVNIFKGHRHFCIARFPSSHLPPPNNLIRFTLVLTGYSEMCFICSIKFQPPPSLWPLHPLHWGKHNKNTKMTFLVYVIWQNFHFFYCGTQTITQDFCVFACVISWNSYKNYYDDKSSSIVWLCSCGLEVNRRACVLHQRYKLDYYYYYYIPNRGLRNIFNLYYTPLHNYLSVCVCLLRKS